MYEDGVSSVVHGSGGVLSVWKARTRNGLSVETSQRGEEERDIYEQLSGRPKRKTRLLVHQHIATGSRAPRRAADKAE